MTPFCLEFYIEIFDTMSICITIIINLKPNTMETITIAACTKPSGIANPNSLDTTFTDFFKKWISPMLEEDVKTKLTSAQVEEVVDKKTIYKEIFKESEHLTQAQIKEVVTCHFPKEAKKLFFLYRDFVVIAKKEKGKFHFDADRLEHSYPLKYNKDRVFYIVPKIAS